MALRTIYKIAGVKSGKVTINTTDYDLKGVKGKITIEPLVVSALNEGDATILGIHTKFKGAKISITQALLDTKFYAAVIGNALTESAGPPATSTLSLMDNVNFPYFKFQIEGGYLESEGTEDAPVSVKVTIYQVKLTEAPKIELDEKEYSVISFEGTAMADASHKIVDIVATGAV